MSCAVLQVEECYAAILDDLDNIEDLAEASIFHQEIGRSTVIFYGNSEQFFDKLRENQAAINRVIGPIAVTFKIGG